MKSYSHHLKDALASDIFEHARSLRYLPRWVVLILDIIICTCAFWLSYFLCQGLFLNSISAATLPIWLQWMILMVFQIVGFWIFHTYAGIIRYSTFTDTLKCLFAVFLATILYIGIEVIAYLAFDTYLLDIALALIYAFIAFAGLFCLRVGVKTLFETMRGMTGKKVLIYGTQIAGLSIAKMLKNINEGSYQPVGFICDATEKHNYELLGMKVYPLNGELISMMKAHHIESVIISPLKMKSLNPAKDLKIFLENNIHILTTPSFKDWEALDKPLENNDLAARIGRIDAIQVEDLLERPTIQINTENVQQIIQGKTILVSGAAGSIGSELVRQVTNYHPQAVVLLEQAESPLHDLTLDLKNEFPDIQYVPLIGDVRNRTRVEQVISETRPHVIFHAAAYKHVPLMENHPNEAVTANVSGTKNMADMAVKYHVERFVMISTDKAVNPTNVMGASKRIAEIYVQSLFKKLEKEDTSCTKFITTRFGNVLGSNGSVIPYFKKQIAAGGPVTVTHPDIIRYFMTIPEACTLVMEAATLGKGGEIFVFDMGHPVKIADLARNMIQLAGYVPGKDIQIEYTGLRPGEKLYEELLNQKETTLPTTNEKIMIARVRENEYDTVCPQIDELIAIAQENKSFMTVRLMKQIVPEYISRHSIFEQLDK